MFKQLKKFFARGGQPVEDGSVATAVAPRSGFRPVSQPSNQRPFVPVVPVVAAPNPEDEDVSIPLQCVLDGLPTELKRRVIPTDLGGATLTVALTKVLTQLPSGAVKLSFGELRRAAPPLFSPGDEADHQEVNLPLNELLVRINPTLLPQSPRPGGSDALKHSFNSGELPDGDEVPMFAAPPRSLATKPTGGPIRVPVPGPTTPTTLKVPLASVTGNWPQSVRAEILQLDCVNRHVDLPHSLVEAGMKLGRVAFPWKRVRSWINPAPPTVISKFDETVLELPLEVLMPLFLARWQQTPKAQSRLVVDESIPPLFAAAAPPASTTVSPNAVSGAGDCSSAVVSATPEAKPKTPGTDFKNRYTSPTAVVDRAIKLAGVAGALVILPEGLLVAGRLSTNHDRDVLAAFLAQAFAKVAQNAVEAQVGEVSRIEFRANNTPWVVFGLEGALLAALGTAAGSLPIPELAILAKDLERKRDS